MTRRLGYLGTCQTPYCGAIEGYFCIACKHYVSECWCRVNSGGCTCPDEIYGRFFASLGERKQQEIRYKEWQEGEHEEDHQSNLD